MQFPCAGSRNTQYMYNKCNTRICSLRICRGSRIELLSTLPEFAELCYVRTHRLRMPWTDDQAPISCDPCADVHISHAKPSLVEVNRCRTPTLSQAAASTRLAKFFGGGGSAPLNHSGPRCAVSNAQMPPTVAFALGMIAYFYRKASVRSNAAVHGRGTWWNGTSVMYLKTLRHQHMCTGGCSCTWSVC